MSNCSQRWLGLVLFLSLATNVFLLGWMFGAEKFPHEKPRQGMFYARLLQKAETLPEPERSTVKTVVDLYKPELERRMRSVMRSRDEIDRMMKDDDYDRAQVEAAFTDMQDRSERMQQLGQEMILDIADVLSPEQRAKFLERPDDMKGKGVEFRSRRPQVPAEPK